MPRYAQIVLGPAGSGKSTYCSTMVRHGQAMKRSIHVVNLDPAAEYFDYPLIADIRDLIHLDDAMEDEALHFGPNGGLVFCMEYFAQNFEWLETELGDGDDDYILFDCPGQIELYTHLQVMRQFVEQLQHWNFHICGVFLMDSQFLVEGTKFFAGVMAALSTMVNLEISFVNVMTKIDLLSKKDKKNLDRFLDPDTSILLEEEPDQRRLGQRYQKLTTALAQLVDDYSLVRFMPLDRSDEDSIDEILLAIDTTLQYGEDADVRTRDIEAPEDRDDDEQAGGGGDDDE